MRFDSGHWYRQDSDEPKPVKSKSYLLMCETRDASKPLPVIRWYRNGRAVRNNRHFYIIVSKLSFLPSTDCFLFDLYDSQFSPELTVNISVALFYFVKSFDLISRLLVLHASSYTFLED